MQPEELRATVVFALYGQLGNHGRHHVRRARLLAVWCWLSVLTVGAWDSGETSGRAVVNGGTGLCGAGSLQRGERAQRALSRRRRRRRPQQRARQPMGGRLGSAGGSPG
ncbi:hypothetical protein K458DRAFT_54331 [Lentithecium fluviatile CBS 122367]|uniref:Uncharacterized protein n=1 Tax=Lentithecium fluviatile CBS 122367 TaxID=1168545 RepID=A0A6G1IXR9_9PLEO|nr:hypothetical protein K458DRAFT_54331 [Lentithecium fluviatile CBS 122367]